MKWNNQKYQKKYRSWIGIVGAKISAQEAPEKECTYNANKGETNKTSLPLMMKPMAIFSQTAITHPFPKKVTTGDICQIWGHPTDNLPEETMSMQLLRRYCRNYQQRR